MALANGKDQRLFQKSTVSTTVLGGDELVRAQWLQLYMALGSGSSSPTKQWPQFGVATTCEHNLPHRLDCSRYRIA